VKPGSRGFDRKPDHQIDAAILPDRIESGEQLPKQALHAPGAIHEGVPRLKGAKPSSPVLIGPEKVRHDAGDPIAIQRHESKALGLLKGMLEETAEVRLLSGLLSAVILAEQGDDLILHPGLVVSNDDLALAGPVHYSEA
jgi:hypothetical protein